MYKNYFPIFKHKPNLTYLDSAASALKLEAVVLEMVKYYETSGSNIGRGGYTIQQEASDAYEATRDYVKTFINAKHREEIVFTKGVTQALNMVANHYQYHLKEGDEVITSHLEHHASFMPWQRIANEKHIKLVFSPLTHELRIDTEKVVDLISSKTKIVALTYISNVMGYITDLKPIIKKAHEVGAVVIIDAAQAIAHKRIDVLDLDCDFLAFSAHKAFGPTGLGVLYGKKHLLEALRPMEVGGGMVEFLDETNQSYHALPLRLEAGTPAIAEVIAFKRALEFIDRIGFDVINKKIDTLHKYALEKLTGVDGITIYNKHADVGIMTFNIEGIHAHDAQSFFNEDNIAVRTGHHCAKLLQKKLDVVSSIRVSFHIYNELEDIDRLIHSIKKTQTFFKGFSL
jgi:cysteine desulfurase/selenocysteine lyase